MAIAYGEGNASIASLAIVIHDEPLQTNWFNALEVMTDDKNYAKYFKMFQTTLASCGTLKQRTLVGMLKSFEAAKMMDGKIATMWSPRSCSTTSRPSPASRRR